MDSPLYWACYGSLLIIASLTGALLAFHHELDDLFNHKLARVEAQNTPIQSVAALHDSVIRTYPQYGFSSLPTTIEAGKSAVFSVDRWRGGKPTTPEPAFNEVYVNPYTGAIIGTRDKEAWAWHNTMWKVFWLHRDLLLGDIGKWVLGIVSLVWTINCFIGFYLTFPRAVKSSQSKQVSSKNAPRCLSAGYLHGKSVLRPIPLSLTMICIMLLVCGYG